MGITWGNPQELDAIAGAAAATLEEDAPPPSCRLFAQNGAAYLVNRGGAGDISAPACASGWKFPLRLLLALVAGIALAFLADYRRPRAWPGRISSNWDCGWWRDPQAEVNSKQ